MRKLLTLLLLTLVVLVSGCIRRGGEGTGTQGVVITSFTSDISVVPPGELTILSLDVENVGEKEAKSVEVTLYGVPFTGTYAWSCENPKKSVDSLYPPDPIAGTPGEMYTFVWQCRAPEVPTELTQEFYVDVSYRYMTDATGTLMVAEEGYLKSLSPRERQEFYSTGGLRQLSVSSGPVTIDVVIPRPLVIRRDLAVRIIIRNVGGGKVLNDEVEFRVNGVSCEEEGRVKLIRGEERTLRCEVYGVGEIIKKAEVPFTVHLDYTYVITSSTSVTIRPE